MRGREGGREGGGEGGREGGGKGGRGGREGGREEELKCACHCECLRSPLSVRAFVLANLRAFHCECWTARARVSACQWACRGPASPSWRRQRTAPSRTSFIDSAARPGPASPWCRLHSSLSRRKAEGTWIRNPWPQTRAGIGGQSDTGLAARLAAGGRGFQGITSPRREHFLSVFLRTCADLGPCVCALVR